MVFWSGEVILSHLILQLNCISVKPVSFFRVDSWGSSANINKRKEDGWNLPGDILWTLPEKACAGFVDCPAQGSIFPQG